MKKSSNSRDFLLKLQVREDLGNMRFAYRPSRKREEYYELTSERQVIMPFRQTITFLNDKNQADIHLTPLLDYPDHQHILHVQTYNRNNPFMKGLEVEIIVDILWYHLDSQAHKTIKFQIVKAQLTHDTEAWGKMTTYVRLLLNGEEISRSEVDKQGDKNPKFNMVSNLNFSSLEDQIVIQIMDKDTFKDDLVGECTLYVFQLLAEMGNLCSRYLKYEGTHAGELQLNLLSGPGYH